MRTVAPVTILTTVPINQMADFGIIEMIKSFEHALSSVVTLELDEIFSEGGARR